MIFIENFYEQRSTMGLGWNLKACHLNSRMPSKEAYLEDERSTKLAAYPKNFLICCYSFINFAKNILYNLTRNIAFYTDSIRL